ncbi:dienelactone hydrolase family protein [Nostoc sp. CENA67]|uniref:Dienelactone hydrolase family protein n=1 Tax=Amazonocrinis nigriterrae CENA67 TaxID=2794033 RepID=A0A8J7LA67_9NOST|nr:dienelactone hydrolase family protein [Amazonocrinis nigriterrae]MBH8566344.1 dienelactone hydrolase family protein [Amazonocrinis nigriterrae CENA67]
MKEITRRNFIATATLATGFALAVQPISANAIATDTKGLIAGAVKIPVPDGQIPAYRAQPATSEKFPIVLVIQEIFGVHEHIQDICRRFAKLGYLAIAPELFVRQGDVSKLSSIDEIRPIVAKVPDAQVLSDLDATVDWAVKSAKGKADQVGITGFCWGGRITWLYAAHNPKVKAGVAWYGRLVANATKLQPQNPVDIASKLSVPVLGLYGGKDTSIPLDTVEQMRDRLKSNSSKSEIIVYPDAPHAFFADYRPSYRQKDARDGWKRLWVWFKEHGL